MHQSKDNNLGLLRLVENLENVINREENILSLISLISKKEYLRLRTSIIDTFEIEDDYPFSGEFGSEVELGDVSTALRETTLELYPETTPPHKKVTYEERQAWCKQVIETMDSAATYY